jgi:UDP-N-acetylmuramyl pentapeptide synthase
MELYSSEHIASLIGGKHHGCSGDVAINYLLIDSRKLVFPSSTLFFAIKTATGDGHTFIDDLYQAGVRSFVVAQLPETANFPEACFFEVSDVVQALQSFATAHRKKFECPVIGITGSNGKTIVKEWLNHLLHHKFQIVRSPRSYNSQLGVPLSIWGMGSEHDLGIFEAGISRPGEMSALQKIIQPTIGLITNIGEAHSDGFVSIEEKLKEKLSLFNDTQVLIYCKDDALIEKQIKGKLKEGKIKTVFCWSRYSADADLVLTKIDKQDGYSTLFVTTLSTEVSFSITFIVYNAI